MFIIEWYSYWKCTALSIRSRQNLNLDLKCRLLTIKTWNWKWSNTSARSTHYPALSIRVLIVSSRNSDSASEFWLLTFENRNSKSFITSAYGNPTSPAHIQINRTEVRDKIWVKILLTVTWLLESGIILVFFCGLLLVDFVNLSTIKRDILETWLKQKVSWETKKEIITP